MSCVFLRLNPQGVGFTLKFRGSTAVIILPHSSSSCSFTWDSTPANNLGLNDSVTIGNYIETPKGKRTWTPGRPQEKAWLIIHASAKNVVVGWKTPVDERGCEQCRPCACLSFEAFEINSRGYLQKVERLSATHIPPAMISGHINVPPANVYVATNGGILVCGARAMRTFSSYTILEGQSQAAKGITLDPADG